MAVSDSREVVIEATPKEILDVIADVGSAPDWSPQYKSSEVLDTYPDGEQTVEYHWSGNNAGWTLIKAGQLRRQEASYTLTPDGAKTKVRFEITIEPSVPIPGFLLKRTIKGAMETATDGLRKQVLKLKKA